MDGLAGELREIEGVRVIPPEKVLGHKQEAVNGVLKPLYRSRNRICGGTALTGLASLASLPILFLKGRLSWRMAIGALLILASSGLGGLAAWRYVYLFSPRWATVPIDQFTDVMPLEAHRIMSLVRTAVHSVRFEISFFCGDPILEAVRGDERCALLVWDEHHALVDL